MDNAHAKPGIVMSASILFAKFIDNCLTKLLYSTTHMYTQHKKTYSTYKRLFELAYFLDYLN